MLPLCWRHQRTAPPRLSCPTEVQAANESNTPPPLLRSHTPLVATHKPVAAHSTINHPVTLFSPLNHTHYNRRHVVVRLQEECKIIQIRAHLSSTNNGLRLAVRRRRS